MGGWSSSGTVPSRSWWDAMKRGSRATCPSCGQGRLFRSYLKVSDTCPACGETLHHHRADDAPPYFTIFIVGHVVLPVTMGIEKAFEPALWVHVATSGSLAIGLSLALLPAVKGAVVGLQWALRMHGFGSETAIEPEQP